mmetsp:Transcript_778/g.1016  ORF Transcript_778/g.1016 Transcript_778/m.1016 type:complete len:84 (+) Transcript_778:41-292(+)
MVMCIYAFSFLIITSRIRKTFAQDLMLHNTFKVILTKKINSQRRILLMEDNHEDFMLELTQLAAKYQPIRTCHCSNHTHPVQH